jgi:predicted nucleic acid-binding protein
MQKVTVVDTSCLILLTKIEQLSLLHQLFGTITITRTIADEYRHSLPNWIQVINPKDDSLKIFRVFLDSGEASAIALTMETPSSLLIIDEVKGRKVAKEIGLKFTGTLGVLQLASKKGLIPNMSEIVEKIKKTDFRVSDDLLKSLLA